MPRRKQDRPQHLEEDMKIDSLISGAVRDCVESMRSERQLVGEIDQEFKEPVINSIKNCNGIKANCVEDLPSMTSRHALADAGTVRPAVISNQEWLDVQSTLSSIQQQLEVLRLQQFQFMQLLASQNKNTNDHTTSNCDSLSATEASESNRGQVEKLSNPSSCEATVEDEPDMSIEKEIADSELVAVDEEKMLGTTNTESEHAFDMDLQGTPENEDEGEPASFDCTKCSAVLPSPELLKLHMYSHERRETTSDQLCSLDKNAESMPNVSAAAQASSSFGSLPPSYQSIINDLSNDSLEEYMEIQKPENTHLEHLVKNMDGTVTDPNQCLICKRILSCKSALMMHYRTHTGERPFKCKLCSRAFTTKGNLKTHMGVHRAKPPLRLLHNCVICNKQFTNALVLNQHMKMHSDESSRKRNFADVQSSITSEECKRQRLSFNSDSSFKEEPMESSFDLVKKGLPVPEFHPLSSVASASNPGFPFDFGGIPSIPDPLRYAEIFARQWEQLNQYSMFNPITSVKPPIFSGPLGLHGPPGLGLPFPLGGTIPPPPNPRPAGKSNFLNNSAIDDFMHPAAGKQRQQEVDGEDKLSEISQNERTTADSVRLSNNSPKSEQSWGSSDAMGSSNGGMKLDPPPGTTCDICLKTFACRSALEIHYRSHTKHRPFKCDMCDKAFTTRGNMKQHILTHKSDDMQWGGASASAGGEKHVMQPAVPSPPNPEILQNNDDLKRTSGRHQCTICLKYFSSASAVQIHFRTHTGDRPFKCGVCGKAFTTKGNLKVHMGTHIWNGSAPPGSERLNVGDGLEQKMEQQEEEVVPVSSPSRSGIMNNNNFGWNPFNHSPLVKPFLGGHPAVMGAYPNMFLPPGGLQPPTTEESKPWSWQLNCHICNKELSSHVALELHMKTHIVNETSSSKAVPAT